MYFANVAKNSTQNFLKCPFKAVPFYIAVQLENTGTKSRLWITLPTTVYKFEYALERSNAQNGNFIITDYARRVPGVSRDMLMRTPLARVNYLAERLNALTDDELIKLYAITDSERCFNGIAEIIEYTYATDGYTLLPGQTCEEMLGNYYLGNQYQSIAPNVKQRIDRRKFGKCVAEGEQGAFSPLGYVTAKNGWQVDTSIPRPIPAHLNPKGCIVEDIYGNLEDGDYDYGV
jgi:hypothetical protein